MDITVTIKSENFTFSFEPTRDQLMQLWKWWWVRTKGKEEEKKK